VQKETQIGEEQRADYSSVRRWPRFKVSLSMQLVLQGPAGIEYMCAHGRDISEGGMAVYVPTELNIGDSATLELTVPYSQEKLQIKAFVRNREGFRYGVEFIDLGQRERDIIANGCRALMLLQ
jgi:c-di-GMP-binding flagellar brake protein YcgR